MPKRVSGGGPVLKDIAAAAEVSIMTASRALRGVEGVSERKRREILKIARRLKYTPNSSARSLVTMNSDLVGIAVPTFFNNVFAEILAGMRRTFDLAGYSSVIDTTEYDAEIELAWAERLLSWRPAGCILTGTQHHPKLVDALRRSGVPTLEIWDVTDDPIDICVGIDHTAAGRQVARHCIALGYRRPAFSGVAEGRDPRAEARLQGFAAEFAEVADAAPVQVARADDQNSFLAGHEGTKELLGGDPPDLIYYLNDYLAFGGMTACQTLGVRVPDDIGIIGFNSLDLASILPVPLSTVRTPRRQMGITGARNLLARIHGVEAARKVVLPIKIIDGATTRRQ